MLPDWRILLDFVIIFWQLLKYFDHEVVQSISETPFQVIFQGQQCLAFFIVTSSAGWILNYSSYISWFSFLRETNIMLMQLHFVQSQPLITMQGRTMFIKFKYLHRYYCNSRQFVLWPINVIGIANKVGENTKLSGARGRKMYSNILLFNSSFPLTNWEKSAFYSEIGCNYVVNRFWG